MEIKAKTILQCLLLNIIAMTCVTLSFAQKNESVKVVKSSTENKIDVLVNNKPFTSFLYPDTMEKSVLYPLIAANGTTVTRGFPLNPQPGEFSFAQAPTIIPQAEVLAVTGSALLNHSLQSYLTLASPAAKVMVLGPSTPLSPVIFGFGVHLLSGIEVVDEQALLESIAGGLSFRKMKGTRRVSLVR